MEEASASSTLSALPEQALPASAAASDTTKVEQLLFFATHQLGNVDTRLMRHYSRQLRYAGETMRLWTLLYQPSSELDVTF